MRIRELRVEGFRSIRRLRLPVADLTVIVGANGAGKSNLYKALMLLAAAAGGGFAKAIAAEGGMPSALWAGPRAKGSVRMELGVSLDTWSYDLELGLPTPTEAALRFDPIVKSETLALLRPGRAAVPMLARRGPSLMLRDREGHRVDYPRRLLAMETALAAVEEPDQFPEIAVVAAAFRGWRFYHHFRTDPGAPVRQPQVGVCTPAMEPDGSDLAAALQSVLVIEEPHRIVDAVAEAFPGTALEIVDHDGRLEVALRQPGLSRPLRASELSDGTLRYLCLVGALASLRLPSLVVLNEPETSLHPGLLPPLARLIGRAAERTQVWVITHSDALAREIEDCTRIQPLRVVREDGETRVAGQDQPA